MLVRDLAHWPPRGDRSFLVHVAQFNLAADKVIIKSLLRRRGTHIVFAGEYEGDQLTFDFIAPTEETAKNLARIILANSGKTLLAIGLMELKK